MITEKIHNARWRLDQHRNWVLPHRRIRSNVIDGHDYSVQSGPFEGLRYLEEMPIEEALMPRLLGCYESELHLPIEQFIARGYDTVIDVGSSEGYYAVGYALRSPKTKVYAFDIDEDMQRRAKLMAELNQVQDQMVVAGECTPSVIQEVASGETLIISDCEGGELELLDPLAAPVLTSCDLLVEVHDHLVAGVSRTMRERFEATHDIFVVNSMMQDSRRYSCLEGLRESDKRVALDERRPVPMQWFIMWRKAGRSA